MRHDDIIRALVAAMRADAALTTALGGEHIYRSGAYRVAQVPSVEWFVVANTLRETTERVRVQLDVWATSYASAVAIEERLRALFQRDLPQTVQGLLMWTELLDARDQPDPEPEVVHRVLDFAFTPARESVR